MTYVSWSCTKHGFYQYEEKYLPRCKQCFTAMKEELEQYKKDYQELNSELVQWRYKAEQLQKKLGEKLAVITLKEK